MLLPQEQFGYAIIYIKIGIRFILFNTLICILLFLVQNQGRVFSINQIYENIWNEEAIAADNTVAVHIRHIREKIEINPKEPRYLKVVWGLGYKVEKI